MKTEISLPKLTYLETAVINRLTETDGLKIGQIGCPNTLRGTLSSLVKKGIVSVSENGSIKLLK